MCGFECLQRTTLKIFGARVLNKIVRLFVRDPFVCVKRRGIWYELDLNEGIDLAIFLFGSFQKHVYLNRLLKIDGPGTIVDVGANIGSMSLMFAKTFPEARVYAFEPTQYAYTKFRRNQDLNPDLAGRITLVQSFISDVPTPNHDIKAYASWRVGGAKDHGEQHPVHLGTVKAADGVAATTLDAYSAQNSLTDIRLIKIDTDGYESQVLQGAKLIIKTQRPYVLFEVGVYVMDEQGIDFDWYLSFFEGLGYVLYDSLTSRLITRHNWLEIIPRYGTVDVLAVPAEQQSQV